MCAVSCAECMASLCSVQQLCIRHALLVANTPTSYCMLCSCVHTQMTQLYHPTRCCMSQPASACVDPCVTRVWEKLHCAASVPCCQQLCCNTFEPCRHGQRCNALDGLGATILLIELWAVLATAVGGPSSSGSSSRHAACYPLHQLMSRSGQLQQHPRLLVGLQIVYTVSHLV